MRLAVAFLSLLGLAQAAPHVRWLDQTAELQEEALEEVLEESPSTVKVRLEDGRILELPATGLVELVREHDEDPEERALLDARLAVRAGEGLDKARAVLDRLAANAEQTWVREYAAANRALLAEEAREKDALSRLEAFLEAHPASRLVPELLVARARARVRAGADVGEAYGEAKERVKELKGPRLLQMRVFVEDMRHANTLPAFDTFAHVNMLEGAVGAELQDPEDVVSLFAAECTRAWLRVEYARGERLKLATTGSKPITLRKDVRRLRNQTRLLLPEVRSDVLFELGQLELACGDVAAAREAWEAAIALVRDPVRERRARKALDSLRD